MKPMMKARQLVAFLGTTMRRHRRCRWLGLHTTVKVGKTVRCPSPSVMDLMRDYKAGVREWPYPKAEVVVR